jgi:hypothetical protein
MGGPGSGSWYRFNKKATVEECHRVDVRYSTQFEYSTRPVSCTVPYTFFLGLLAPYLARGAVLLPVVRMSLKDFLCASTVVILSSGSYIMNRVS